MACQMDGMELPILISNNRFYWLTLCLLSFFFHPIFATPVILSTFQNQYSISQNLEYFEDKTSTITINEIKGNAFNPFFKQNYEINPNYSFSQSTYWFRFRAINQRDPDKLWILEFSYPFLDEIEVYFPVGDQYITKTTGWKYPLSSKEIKTRYFAFYFPKNWQPEKYIYFKIRSNYDITIPVKIYPSSHYIEVNHRSTLIFGLYYGLLLVILFFNLILYIFLKDKSYLYYVLLNFFWIFVQLGLNGLSIFLWPNLPWWNKTYFVTAISISAFFGFLFINNFLELKTNSQALYNFNRVLMILTIILGGLSFTKFYTFTIIFAMISSLFLLIVLFSAIVVTIRKKIKYALYFAIAWSTYLIGILFLAIRGFGIIPYNIYTIHTAQIGSALMVIFLSLALADKLNFYIFENENVERIIINEQNHSLTEQKKQSISFYRFVPKEFLTFLNRDTIKDIQLGDHIEKSITILVADIFSFTELSEKMSPEDNFSFLNSYLQRIGPIINNHQGFIEKYLGDGFMAIFPVAIDHAIQAAIDIQNELKVYNRQRKRLGYLPITTGIGLHTGNTILGTIGEKNRIETTVISPVVNVAARIERLTRIYTTKILISAEIIMNCFDPSVYNYRYIDTVKVKGKNDSVSVFEILDGLEEDDFYLKMITKELFEKAIILYQEKQFAEAKDLFKQVIAINQQDNAATILSQKCQNYIQQGIPLNWDGVSIWDV
ncbi:MAG: hypothetical protein MJB14_17105 [Spirochaetes bacterium]|nr:hypothetical protein [Spirochaetota bacterium]